MARVAFYICAFTLKDKRRSHLSRASGNLSNLLRGGAEERCCSCLLSDRNTWQLVEAKQTTCHSNGVGGSAAEHGIMGSVVLWRPSVPHALLRDLCRESLLGKDVTSNEIKNTESTKLFIHQSTSCKTTFLSVCRRLVKLSTYVA